MRTECKHYESRTYGANETVRKCQLDLAPEAPWKCPESCPAYERRLVDVGWTYGTLGDSMGAAPPEPEVTVDADVAALLDEAEDIVNAVGPELLAEFAKRDAADAAGRKKKRFRKKKR